MRRPSWIALCVASAVAVGVVRWFDVNPIELEVIDAEVRGAPAERDELADVLVVVDHETIAESAVAGTYEALDLSYAWANLLRQEFGRFGLADAARLDPARLAGARVVIVTQSAVAAVAPATVSDFVAAGGTVVVERPDAEWGRVAGVVTGRPADASAFTGLPALTSDGNGDRTARTLADELLAAPLPTTLAPLTASDADVVVRASVDGHAAWTSLAVGRGSVQATGLDVGRLVTSLQQGTPDAGGLDVVNRFPDRLSPFRQTSDLVADERLLDATVPYADLFERLVAHLLEEAAPLPRWWPFPEAAPGAYVATHDEESMGDTSTWMADAERAWGVPGTDYVIAASNLTPEGAAQLGGDGRTLGIHQVCTLASGAPRHEMGIGRVLPFVRRFSLAEQMAAFEKLTGYAARSNRNHYLLWGGSWAEDFRRLAAAGVELDTSYGPDVDSLGYLFGTGLPFRALDDNGLPLPIDELPLLTAENLGGADHDFLVGLLRGSAERHHQVVTTLFHPNVFLWRPDAAIYEQWRDSFHVARELGLWITHVDAILAQEVARRESPLTSTWTGGVLAIHSDVRMDGLTLSIPAETRGRPVRGVVLDGRPTEPGRSVSDVGGERLLVVLRPGVHTLEVAYDWPEAPR